MKKDGLWGYVNTSGEIVIPFQFDDAGYFSETLAKINKKDQWGFINTAGEIMIPLYFNSVNYFRKGLSLVGKDDLSFYIDKTGDIVISGCKIIWKRIGFTPAQQSTFLIFHQQISALRTSMIQI